MTTPTIRQLAQPFIDGARHLILTMVLVTVMYLLYIIVTGAMAAVSGDGTGLFFIWGIALVIAYRICRHHVF